MRISTIVLNWNRKALLEKCLQSYAATIESPFQLIVIDNASSDGSHEVIDRFCTEVPFLEPIFLKENLGGEAINVALEHATGDLIHISENDQLFLAGWSRHVRECFTVFAGLGQLSLHGVVPTDEEVWEVKPAHLRFSSGKIVYEAHGNVGTSSLIPARVFRGGGVRMHDISQEDEENFKFPNDARLSADIKKMGLFCGWSDRYYVRNLGHERGEFDRDPEYYRRNYASKHWLGMNGFIRRLETARSRPRVHRRSIVFPGVTLQPEKTNGENRGKSAQLWSMFDGFTAETEVLDFLYTLVRLVKPARAIETGTWLGRSAVAISTAMRDNGFGKLTTLEVDPDVAKYALAALESAQLGNWVEVIIEPSLIFQPDNDLEFALLDSDIGIRVEEFCHFYEKLAPGAIVVFHDTGAQHAGLAESISELISQGRLAGLFLPTPRGIFVGSAQKPPVFQSLAVATLNGNRRDAGTQGYPRDREAILVLGMHRSGSSALAHLLNVLGAKLPEQVMGPGYGNPLGHWEPIRLMEINDEILTAIGRRWADPRPIPQTWFRSKEAYTFHERIAAEIAFGYGTASLLLIKEPRICRLAPLYFDVLDALGIKPRVILPIRHPGEVIRSIEERDKIDPRTIELLWLRSLLEAEEASRSCVRVWTSFERLLDNREQTAQQIADGLGVIWPNNLAKMRDQAKEVVRSRHRHHQITDGCPSAPLTSLTSSAWQAAQYALNGDEAAARPIFDEIRGAMIDFDCLITPLQERNERLLADSRTAGIEAELRSEAALIELRRQIDSIRASICWRVTSPIRWIHSSVIWARNALGKTRFCDTSTRGDCRCTR